MSAVDTGVAKGGAFGAYAGPVIDTDVHVQIGTVENLYPFMEEGWREWIQSTSFRLPPSLGIHFPPRAPTTTAPEWAPADGGLAAADYPTLRDQILDPHGVEYAIVNPYWGLDSLRHPELAARLAQAINDWLIENFLDKDARLRGSLTVVHHDPVQAIREIERVGDHPGFVQVHLPIWSQLPWGKRLWHPLFKAIAGKDLVATLHYGGVPEATPTPTGWPAYYVEHLAGAQQIYLTQLVNIVGEGLFQAVPDLRMTFQESGFTWLPGLLWRVDKEWKGLRRDIPWVNRAPSATLREKLRVCVQPIDGAPPEELPRILDWLGSEEMLVYGSDYPRWHEDRVATLLDVVPDTLQRKIMAENARAHYRL